jgi:hypothetical protein
LWEKMLKAVNSANSFSISRSICWACTTVTCSPCRPLTIKTANIKIDESSMQERNGFEKYFRGVGANRGDCLASGIARSVTGAPQFGHNSAPVST